MRALKKILSFLKKNSGVLLCVLGALLLNIMIELLYRQSVSAVLELVKTRPIAFLENVLIIAFCLSLSLFAKRKWFYAVLIGAVWAGLGIGNMYVLTYRVSPLSAIDFLILQLDWSFIGIYMSVTAFVLLAFAVLLLLFGLFMLFRKCPKTPVQPVRTAITCGALFLSLFILPLLPTGYGFAGNAFKDVINLTEQYGFAYTFTRSVVDTGIDRPEDYSARRVNAIADEVLRTETVIAAYDPNIIFLQLESFFDITHLKNVEFSEDPVPYFRELKENNASGYFVAPSVGAGTANTEFEVLTQMDVHMFGPGEYPFKTVLQEETCESLAYILKERGLSAHAIHNNTATFYDRHLVYANLGFDTFTAVEHMTDVEYNEIGWAKDSVLTKEIAQALDSTEGMDLVYAISVQPHGAYPTDSENRPIRVLSGIEDEDYRAEMEFYAAQIREVDDFLRELTAYLEARGEKTVLVIYGDHLPAFEIDETMLTEGDEYCTEYVVWSDFPLSDEDRDVYAYQLASHVFEKICINDGALTKFHQRNAESGAYVTELLTLQYDMLYGDRIVFHGVNPFEPTDMRFGTKPIRLQKATHRADRLTAYGERFTPYSVIFLNGDAQETVFVSENEIYCTTEELPEDARVSVRQVAEDGTVLSSAGVL